MRLEKGGCHKGFFFSQFKIFIALAESQDVRLVPSIFSFFSAICDRKLSFAFIFLRRFGLTHLVIVIDGKREMAFELKISRVMTPSR